MCKTFSDVRNSDNATRLEALANYTVQYNEDNYVRISKQHCVVIVIIVPIFDVRIFR
jgi:hypothetical protein